MLRIFPEKWGLGIEITASSVRLAAMNGSGPKAAVPYTRKADLPFGIVTESYSALNITDTNAFASILKECKDGAARFKTKRVALSLPDGIFRVQTLEFDHMPEKPLERERLIRWRMEKAAAFDTADTVLRHQVLHRQDTGFTVLASVAKRSVLAQYEALLAGLGLELWSVGLSSFNVLNFYSPYLSKKSAGSAIVTVTGDTFTTIISESNGVRFYRFKEIKKGAAEDVNSRLLREIGDSLHFYTHMNRSQQCSIGNLFLTGEPGVYDALAGKLAEMTSCVVEVLSPSMVIVPSAASGTDAALPPVFAAALGAGGSL